MFSNKYPAAVRNAPVPRPILFTFVGVGLAQSRVSLELHPQRNCTVRQLQIVIPLAL